MGDAFGKFVDEVFINFLLDILSLLLYTAINKIELLSLVEILFIGITEDVAWKERYLLGEVLLHTIFYFIYL